MTLTVRHQCKTTSGDRVNTAKTSTGPPPVAGLRLLSAAIVPTTERAVGVTAMDTCRAAGLTAVVTERRARRRSR